MILFPMYLNIHSTPFVLFGEYPLLIGFFLMQKWSGGSDFRQTTLFCQYIILSDLFLS